MEADGTAGEGEESIELKAFKAYLIGQENSHYLQTILSFKTV